MLGWGVRDLAEKAGVGTKTVTRFERGGDIRKSTLDKFELTLEDAGIEFLNTGDPGIRWRA